MPHHRPCPSGFSDAMTVRKGVHGELCYSRTEDPHQEVYSYQKPFILELEITRRCNLRCLHCYADAAADGDFDDELTLEEIQEVLDQAAALGIHELSLTGGEVLMHPEFLPIVDAGLSRGMAVRFVTNGTLVDQALVAELCRRPIKLITVSLDGIDAAVHNRLRGVACHEDTLHGIRLLEEAGLTLSIITAFSSLNVHEFDRLLDFCGAHRLNWQVQMTSAKGRCARGITLSPQEYYRLGEKVAAAMVDSGLPLVIIPMDDLATPSRMAPLWPLFATWQGQCTGGLLNLFVRADGTVTPCSALSFPQCVVGTIRSPGGLTRICLEERCKDYLARFSTHALTGACAACVEKEVCRGGCPEILMTMCPEPTENRYCYRRIEGDHLLEEWFSHAP